MFLSILKKHLLTCVQQQSFLRHPNHTTTATPATTPMSQIYCERMQGGSPIIKSRDCLGTVAVINRLIGVPSAFECRGDSITHSRSSCYTSTECLEDAAALQRFIGNVSVAEGVGCRSLIFGDECAYVLKMNDCDDINVLSELTPTSIPSTFCPVSL